MMDFPEVQRINVGKQQLDKIVLNRKTASYSYALEIARLIILNYSPDISSGNEKMLSLLFDMNKLWEEYVYRVLAKHQDGDLKVRFQNSDKFWEKKHIKPDIVLTKTNDEGNKGGMAKEIYESAIT